MLRKMQKFSYVMAIVLIGGLLLSVAPSATSAHVRHRIVIVQPVAPFYYDPFFYDPYWYPYAPYYPASNSGAVKIDTHHRLAKVYIDGGYAATITKSKKFALRPGTHNIVLKNSDDVTFYHKRVAVLVGQTTKLSVS